MGAHEESSTSESAFALAVRQHRFGQLSEAEAGYRAVLAGSPTHAGALQMLGVLMVQIKRPTDGIELLRRAVLHAPEDSNAWYNFANALKGSDQFEEAIDAYRRAIRCDPASSVA
ncbi:MAG TPA: tetratricopeptide repeat protein, partial [Humisphaera sp.]|nr:tetratricopeptide repeat protein [Humisphaera sp.]